MLSWRAQLSGGLLLASLAPAHAGPDAATLLFEAPALAELRTGSMLVYRLERLTREPAAPMPAPAGSGIELSLRPDETGGRSATVELVTEAGRQPAGSFPGGVGNPVLLVFLERDVAAMARLLHGSPYYIRNRIREAIGADPPIASASFTYDGRNVEGWRIEVSPFTQDRNRDKLREHAARRYEFTLSDAVPGRLYEIRAVTPGAEGTPLVEDRLVLDRVEPAPESGR